MARLLAVVVCAVAAFAPAASAQTITTVPADVPIGSHDGWVAWSVPDNGAWRLSVWHAGVARSPAIPSRSAPFDLDVGTDAKGSAVATFSRCRVDGSACGLRVLDLATGVERSAGVPRPRGASDRQPSMWRGRIAFARSERRYKKIDQVRLWNPATRTLRRLRHGAVPSRCPFRSCVGMETSGTVVGVDLGSRLLAFRWQVSGPAVVGHGGWEVRANRLRDGRSFLVGAGSAGEVCTGGTDSVTPSAPTVDGSRVWFVLTSSNCYRYTHRAVRFDPAGRRGRMGRFDAAVLQFVKDENEFYALVSPRLEEGSGACESKPCEIGRIEAPALDKDAPNPRSPFF